MTLSTLLLLGFALITKHFICDFLLQNKYQWSNKGTYGHGGGMLHAFITALGSFIAILAVLWKELDPDLIVALYVVCTFEGIIHYHIDWAKMNINKKLNWTPSNSEAFWCLLGFDQYLHYLTYLAMLITIYSINT